MGSRGLQSSCLPTHPLKEKGVLLCSLLAFDFLLKWVRRELRDARGEADRRKEEMNRFRPAEPVVKFRKDGDRTDRGGGRCKGTRREGQSRSVGDFMKDLNFFTILAV